MVCPTARAFLQLKLDWALEIFFSPVEWIFSLCFGSICLFRSCWLLPPNIQLSHFSLFCILTSLVTFAGTGTLGFKRLSKNEVTSCSVSFTFKAFFKSFPMSFSASCFGFGSPAFSSDVGASVWLLLSINCCFLCASLFNWLGDFLQDFMLLYASLCFFMLL